MNTKVWCAALVGMALLALSGCGDVESCERGEIGCIDGPADPRTGCKFGLTRNSGGFCTADEPGPGSDAGSGPVDDAGSGPVDACGGCPSGSLCNEQKQCVNYCELPDNLPVLKPAPLPCRPPAGEAPYTFEQAAVALCTQECVRRNEYCGTTCDPAITCTPANAMQLLMAAALCPGREPNCATLACEAARDRPCERYNCPAGAAPNCAGISCTNTCPTSQPDLFPATLPQWVNDGLCDDGDLSNAITAACVWGGDCGDCGPRRGAAPPFERGLGELCVDPIQCGGDTFDVRRATGWCVGFSSQAVSVQRCIPDCSSGQACPSGFECQDLVYETEDGSRVPVQDDLERIARGCFPPPECS